MFILKFFNYYESGASRYKAIACPHYTVYEHTNSAVTVTVYKNLLETDGVEYHLCHRDLITQFSNETEHFYHEQCFIENADGKTVDVIRPKNPHPDVNPSV